MIALGLFLVFLGLISRTPVDNDALRNCAAELKRIADALATPRVSGEAPSVDGLVAEVRRIANVAERRE